jgi:hypothetical protein
MVIELHGFPLKLKWVAEALRRSSEAEVTQPSMTVRAATKWPVKQPLLFADRKVVDAREATNHQTVLVEFPVFIAK